MIKKIKTKENLFEKLLNIIIWIFGILIIYWLVLKLTNHSPTIEQVGVGIFVLIATLVFKNEYKSGRIDEFRSNTEKELSLIKNKVDKIESDVIYLKSDISHIKSDISFVSANISDYRFAVGSMNPFYFGSGTSTLTASGYICAQAGDFPQLKHKTYADGLQALIDKLDAKNQGLVVDFAPALRTAVEGHKALR